MKTEEEMIAVNEVQAQFYDSIQAAEQAHHGTGYAENKAANLSTRLWAAMRDRQQAAINQAGIHERVARLHRTWFEQKAGGAFLELGCFSGSRMTFDLIETSGSYTGIELSRKAVDTLNQKITGRGFADKAKAVSQDFLTYEADSSFDLLYAHGVLHHFENPQPLFRRIARLLKPDGVLIFCEPSTINRAYRLIRSAYRPFQSDKDWEWPFTENTVDALEQNFEVAEGFGWGRQSLPLSVLTGLPVVGPAISKCYIATVEKEVSEGWHRSVWTNSYLTALYRKRDEIGLVS